VAPPPSTPGWLQEILALRTVRHSSHPHLRCRQIHAIKAEEVVTTPPRAAVAGPTCHR
jgi:hypothetical protein